MKKYAVYKWEQKKEKKLLSGDTLFDSFDQAWAWAENKGMDKTKIIVMEFTKKN